VYPVVAAIAKLALDDFPSVHEVTSRTFTLDGDTVPRIAKASTHELLETSVNGCGTTLAADAYAYLLEDGAWLYLLDRVARDVHSPTCNGQNTRSATTNNLQR
jgi:hypothetical protein